MASREQEDVVYALATSPITCFAARHSGLYLSGDGGETWRYAYDSLNTLDVLVTPSVALSPDFEHDHTVFAGIVGGVVRSSDGGDTWHVSAFRSPPPTVSVIGVSANFARDSLILAGTVEDGIFRSTDGGRLWSAANFGLLDLSVFALHFADDETVYAGTSSGVFKSMNGGLAWREVDLPCGFEPVLSLALSQDGGVFAGTETQGLLHSTDEGKSWARLGTDSITGAVNQIVLTSTSVMLVVHDGSLLISRDGGGSWESAAALDDVTAVSPAAPLLVGTATGGIYRV